MQGTLRPHSCVPEFLSHLGPKWGRGPKWGGEGQKGTIAVWKREKLSKHVRTLEVFGVAVSQDERRFGKFTGIYLMNSFEIP